MPAVVHTPPDHDPPAPGDAPDPRGPPHAPVAVDAWRLVLVGVAAGVTMLLHVLVGHAAGPSPLRSVNLFVQWLHLLAVGAWIGGLAWLLAGLRGKERPEQLASAARFSRLAAPLVGLVAVTGLSRALHLAGGWQGLLDSGYGRFLDLKVALFLGLVALGAMNRYRVLPALASGARRIDALRRNVRGEVVLAVCILAVTAVLSQLPPGKFVVEQAAAKPPAPPSVQVEGSDFATSVRIALTVSPGRPGPNTFTAKVTDYDSGEDWPADRVVLRFTAKGRPEIGASTLELARAGDGSWGAQGSQLSIAGTWAVVGLVEGSGPAVTVPMELEARAAPQPVKVSEAPGQPTLYTITLAAGGTLQGYIDPGQLGPNTVHFTFFNPAGDEQPTDKARARMTRQSGATEPLTLIRLGPGHFAANVDLEPGRVAFAIDATTGKTQRRGPVRAAHRVEERPMMRRLSRTRRVRAAVLLAAAALAVTACSGGDGGSTPPAATTVAAAPRPSSPAKLTIMTPRNGQTVRQDRPEVRLELVGGKIVSQTTNRIQGDEGHIHLLVDGKLVAMNYGLRERLPQLPPGQHVVQVEFVAADHAPFDPRVLTQAAFQVAG